MISRIIVPIQIYEETLISTGSQPPEISSLIQLHELFFSYQMLGLSR